MSAPRTTTQKRKQTNLETADQMFKDAFLVKKTRFSHLHPHLSDEELTKMTAEYFRRLNEGQTK
jgi:hypothetical protein